MKHAILSLLLLGCAGSDLSPDDARAAQQKINDTRAEVEQLDGETRGLLLGIEIACGYQDRIPAIRSLCARVTPLDIAITDSLRIARTALDAADAGLVAADEVRKAVAAVKLLVVGLRVLLGEVGSDAGKLVHEGGGEAHPASGGPAEAEAAPAPGQVDVVEGTD